MLIQGEGTFASRFKVNPNYSVAYIQNITPTHSRSKRPSININQRDISEKQRKRMQCALRWMLLFSKEKTVYSKSKKSYFKFRINFITLTLSAAQQHPDTFILHSMLFPFLKYLERSHKVTAYIWRAEIQGRRLRERKERCIHFHITTDRFIHWRKIRNKWNALQLAHGYRAAGTDPNSTDVHSVKNTGSIIRYMGKYITKKVKRDDEKVDCKIYGMSRNLSLMNTTLREEETEDYRENVNAFIKHHTTGSMQTDHAKIYFNDLSRSNSYPYQIQNKLEQMFELYHKGIEVPDRYEVE